MSNSHYDLIVIGSGPAGRRAAIQAAKIGKNVLRRRERPSRRRRFRAYRDHTIKDSA